MSRGARRSTLLLAAAAACLLTAQLSAQPFLEAPPSVREQVEALLEKAAFAMAAVYDYRGVLIKKELFGDELVTQKLAFKFSRPFKVYVRYIEPHEGREGLYVRGEDKNRIRAHRGSMASITVSLSPYGRVSMIDNHHPITSFGLENMLAVGAPFAGPFGRVFLLHQLHHPGAPLLSGDGVPVPGENWGVTITKMINMAKMVAKPFAFCFARILIITMMMNMVRNPPREPVPMMPNSMKGEIHMAALRSIFEP